MNNLVLSIFPGIDLLGRAFEEEGFQIFRGPDILWGGDIRDFHPPEGLFDGVIGGAPCQVKSQLSKLGNVRAVDLLDEFIRVVKEAKPDWVVMENVRGYLNHPDIPADWFPVKLRDWDCGGFTFRFRIFWVYPSNLIFTPPKRDGRPQYSVLAYSWKGHDSQNKEMRMHSNLSIKQAAELQGFPELAKPLEKMGKEYAVSLLGNGVPKAMGQYIARAIKRITHLEDNLDSPL